jgi:hypothetical protein
MAQHFWHALNAQAQDRERRSKQAFRAVCPKSSNFDLLLLAREESEETFELPGIESSIDISKTTRFSWRRAGVRVCSSLTASKNPTARGANLCMFQWAKARSTDCARERSI